MTLDTHLIFLYTTNSYKELRLESDAKCEDVCVKLCEELKISPSVRLLFSLRINGTHYWVPPCRTLCPNLKYEFRLRFKVPDLTVLEQFDINAYNYYYNQVRRDLICTKIPEIEYSKHKDKIVGLGVTDMYLEIIEKNTPIDYLEKNYKSYVPKEIVHKHSIFLKKAFATTLRQIKKKNHKPEYVKRLYLEQINKLAPNYLMEEYNGRVHNLDESSSSEKSNVKIQFSPFHPEQPGLRIFDSCSNLWKHVSTIEDIYAIISETKRIKIEMKNEPTGYCFEMPSTEELESLVTCISGYYRLMCKWTIDLCRQLPTPSLIKLQKLICHGPIGGQFSYTKLEEKNNVPGSYIIRQCEREYNTYYIDMITKNNQPETIKITSNANDSEWFLHYGDGIRANSLAELPKHIKTESTKKYRFAPSEYDKPPFLLLCLPPLQYTYHKTVSDLSVLREITPRLVNAETELLLYKNSINEIDGGIVSQMRADWKISKDQKLEVTLKILQPNRLDYLPSFMKLANEWCKINTSEILKLYGISLYTPIAMILESTKHGPFDKFLKLNSKLEIVSLIDAAYSLARALHYLQENKIIHTRIRCSSLQVTRYTQGKVVTVKLGDPGFQKHYSRLDIPWIPPEYHSNMERAKTDLRTDIWAYATTLWEIFSLGKNPNDFYFKNKKLPELKNCPKQIMDIIREGWDPNPDKRFSPQNIFSTLILTRESYNKPFTPPESVDGSQISLVSGQTENTDVDTLAESDSISDGSITDQDSCIFDYDVPPTDDPETGTLCDTIEHIPHIYELRDFIVIFQGKIGVGHYGTVYRGQIEYREHQTIQDVAIKILTSASPNDPKQTDDFKRESYIMKELNHRNIVKIIEFIEQPHISIIMEYIKHRSFLMYLNSYSPSLTTSKLLNFAKDIASGMEYLRSKNIVHRDLAARNILVDSNECVKISDFGLAQFAGPNGYYTIQSAREIPMKWYAPETLQTNKYSFKSDVWSYGVTLFEMFSRGQEPNLIPGKDLSLMELVEYLRRGIRLQRPPLCPEIIYNTLMLTCWDGIPENRPNFTDILDVINKLIPQFIEPISNGHFIN